MNPRQFEELVCQHFLKEGYRAEITSYSNDYGIDIFVTKGEERIAVQVKMYGDERKINRKMVMELHGAKDYFDCTGAIIATDGALLADALLVANKLSIKVLFIESSQDSGSQKLKALGATFETIWEDYIIPLEGKVLTRETGETNKIVKVNWSEVQRITSKGNLGKIEVEIFKQAINKLLKDGFITRDYINQNYIGRASSGVILILSEVPFFQLTAKPLGLKYLEISLANN